MTAFQASAATSPNALVERAIICLKISFFIEEPFAI
jgi:hypothetical protein